MIWVFAPLAFLAGSLARRVAGGVLADWFGWRAPGTLAKLAYAGTIGGLAALAGATWWFALLLAINVFVGHVAHGLWGAGSMGRRGPQNEAFTWRTFARDWFALWGYGFGQVIVAALAAAWIAHPWWASAGPVWDAGRDADYRWLPLVLGGLSSSPAYALSWALWERRWLPFWAGMTRDPLQLGESLFGGCLGIAALLCAG